VMLFENFTFSAKIRCFEIFPTLFQNEKAVHRITKVGKDP